MGKPYEISIEVKANVLRVRSGDRFYVHDPDRTLGDLLSTECFQGFECDFVAAEYHAPR